MKKQLLLFGLIFGMFVAFAQTTETKSEPQPTATADSIAEPQNDFCPHRILLRIGGGYANNTFKPIKKVADRCSYTAMAEIGYTYFFHRNVGIGIGVGINHIGEIAKIKDSRTLYDLVDPRYNDGKDPYDLTYSTDGFKEKINTWAIEVPLTIQFEKKWGNNGIYAGVGVKGYFPIASKLRFTDGTIELDNIYDPGLNLFMNNLIVHLDGKDVAGTSNKQKMRCSIDVLGEFGGIFGIARNTDIYVGVFASYGFLNVLPKNGISLDDIKVTEPVFGQVFEQYTVTPKKWNQVQVGLKFGFHFLPCKSCGNDEYMSDLKRRYMKEMMKKKNEPIVVTNTVQEYYYVVPTVAQELLDESANDPNKKKAIQELAQTLSNIKILFDLDKDIPKLDDYKRDYIKNASDLLKKNPDLKVIISGYTSPEGTVNHNKDLGHRRALAVRQIFLEKHGVPADQIAVQNFTAEDPQHKIDIPEKDYSEQRAVIFKIEKK